MSKILSTDRLPETAPETKSNNTLLIAAIVLIVVLVVVGVIVYMNRKKSLQNGTLPE